MSEQLDRFKKYRNGYRYDNTDKCKYSFEEMLKYEIEELGNSDIYKTISDLYKKDLSSIKDIIRFCQSKLGSDILYYNWICADKNFAKKLYYYEGLNLYLVQVFKPCIVISDLGVDGLLVVSSNKILRLEL